jgi:hypothetical protein
MLQFVAEVNYKINYFCFQKNNLIYRKMQLQVIQTKIYEVKGQKVMLDYDLAELYEVQTKNLNLAVKRNLKRFPLDFMFQLTKVEWEQIISQRLQNETLEKGRGKYSKYLPHAFTEQGVAMLSGILKSEKAIDVNIVIMRAFIALKQFALTNIELNNKLKELEKTYNKQFKDVYEAINYLIQKDKQEISQKERKQIGYKTK